MTREELDRRNAVAVTRHSRALGDDPRNPPRALLDELAANAQAWARSLDDEHRGERALADPDAIAAKLAEYPDNVATMKPPAAPKTPRRTPTRRSAK